MTRITSAQGPIRTSIGETLHIAVPGKIEGGQPPIVYTRQWHVEGRPVNGETGDTFVVRAQDEHKKITCVTTATDAIGRVLILKPSNEIYVGQAARGASGPGQCPPRVTKECPTAPPIQRRVKPAQSSSKPVPKPAAKKPTQAQIRAEMRKAGGCRSCAERARARRKNQSS